MESIITIYLLLLSVLDIRKKKIPLLLLLIPLVVLFIILWLNGKAKRALCGMIPGIFSCLLSFFLPGSIGLGDGILIIVYGTYYGWEKACIWSFFSFWLVAIYGICISMKKQRKKKLPFIPFLTCIHIGGRICGIF